MPILLPGMQARRSKAAQTKFQEKYCKHVTVVRTQGEGMGLEPQFMPLMGRLSVVHTPEPLLGWFANFNTAPTIRDQLLNEISWVLRRSSGVGVERFTAPFVVPRSKT